MVQCSDDTIAIIPSSCMGELNTVKTVTLAQILDFKNYKKNNVKNKFYSELYKLRNTNKS